MKCLSKLVILLISLCVLSACDAVFSPEPLGEETVVLDAAQWQGTWLGPETVVMTTVLDAEKGLLQAAWLERGEDGAFLEITRGVVRAHGERLYLNTLDDNDKVPTRYLFSRFDLDERKATLWTPRLVQFKAMVADGRIPGEVTDDGVVLAKLEPRHLDMIEDTATGLLDWQEPLVFYRIGD